MDVDPLLLSAAAAAAGGGGGGIAGVVDYRGLRVSISDSGGWTSALFIIGVEVAERFAFSGILANLINYLTGSLHESTAAAASAVNIWFGASLMLPFLGAFVADSYIGRYRMILTASFLYVLGLGMLTVSTMLPSSVPPECNQEIDPTICTPSQFQVVVFYVSIYLVAFAQGGHKPCVQAFGADQFDQNDAYECEARSSFFNWWYFSMSGGIFASLLILTYIQDSVSWSFGFGIPCIVMGIALVIFLLGTKTYRFYPLEDRSPFIRIGKTLISMARSKRPSGNNQPAVPGGEADETSQHGSNKSELSSDCHHILPVDGCVDVHSILRVEEAKGMLQLFPIWATCLMYGVTVAQSSTFFTKQGSTMDRRVGSCFQIPAAALQCFIPGTVVAFIPIYDRFLVPAARKFSNIPSGITILQRIGAGILVSAIAMVVAALVESKRLKTARDLGLVDLPMAVIPMSLWWLVPQYILYGIAEAFAMVGLQEFFYDQVPDSLRSIGLALYLGILGIGSFISSFLIYTIDQSTSRTGGSWFSSNLNRGHLDYFYWLLAGVSFIGLGIYFYLAKSYVYKRKLNDGL